MVSVSSSAPQCARSDSRPSGATRPIEAMRKPPVSTAMRQAADWMTRHREGFADLCLLKYRMLGANGGRGR